MPKILSKNVEKDIHICIWKITEELTFFTKELDKANFDYPIYKSVKRTLESICVRYLIATELGEDIYLSSIKGTDGIWNFLTDQKFSITHQYPYALLAHSKRNLGIDVQMYTSKILNIYSRFLSPQEIQHFHIENLDLSAKIKILTQLWTIKESIYKAMRKKGVEFKNDILIKQQNLNLVALIFNHEVDHTFKVYTEFEDVYCWSVVY